MMLTVWPFVAMPLLFVLSPFLAFAILFAVIGPLSYFTGLIKLSCPICGTVGKLVGVEENYTFSVARTAARSKGGASLGGHTSRKRAATRSPAMPLIGVRAAFGILMQRPGRLPQ